MRNDNPITVVTLTFLTFAAVLLLVRFWPDLDGWQSYICHGDCTLLSWLSALSGWAAVAAALPTIYFLSRQVDAAVTANRNAARIALRRSMAIAAGAKSLADISRNVVEFFEVDKAPTPENLIQYIKEVGRCVDSKIFRTFEDEIESPPHIGIQSALHILSKSAEDIEHTESGKDRSVLDYDEAIGVVLAYLEWIDDAADRFIAEAKTMTA